MGLETGHAHKTVLISVCFIRTFKARNLELFLLGVSTGGRISEFLSLQISNVYQNGSAVSGLLFDKSIVKGGEVSRAVPVSIDDRDAIDDVIAWHQKKYRTITPSRPLFSPRNQSGSVAMNRQTAHEMLKNAFIAAGLNGKLATHSLRKSFAQPVYEQSGDIYLVQKLLGHRNMSTTQNYLSVNYASAREPVEGIAFGSEWDKTDVLSNSLTDIDDETLQSELEKRGYNITSRRTDEAPAEIIKIG